MFRSIAVAVAALYFAPSIFALHSAFPYGTEKIRGVSLGGWLSIWPFVTPSLFDAANDSRIIDEFTFSQYQDRKKVESILKHHWDTWITEDDFIAISKAGLNHVKVPLGTWAFGVNKGEPFVQGQLPYLKKAAHWAQKHGLKLLIDFHGAPGSQNGFLNSGHFLASPTWHTSKTNIEETSTAVKQLAWMFKDMTDTVTIIDPLNETPAFLGPNVTSIIKDFYTDSYGNIRYPYGNSRKSSTIVLLHDGFSLNVWDDFMITPEWEGVMFDTHFYQGFALVDQQRTYDEHIKWSCNYTNTLKSSPHRLVVGEWTTAISDCGLYLGGIGMGSKYDGTAANSTQTGSCEGLTGPASKFSPSYKAFLRKLWEAQVIAFERGSEGWFQWNWKMEIAQEWSYKSGLQYGWIPQHVTDLKYPHICD
ncbi:glycoside hydrolase family 5 protein [Crucibulum laeve]|uniref:Glycoside hydrolase family 5 protein n=1 Tax=Crucibulum laeve TaxID=68775 RepID=A0A5C3LZ85_9AGAR|nr:glycoside hydrolase family 5 protein [Crucibulum laeve]